MSGINLNPNECKVLKALAAVSGCYGDFGFVGFKYLARKTRLNRKEVRRAARSLRRKGFAEYGRGLSTEDGEVAGSGYGCTRAGFKFLEDV